MVQSQGIGFDSLGGFTIPRLGQQIAMYLAQAIPRDDQLFTILIGHNDFGGYAEQSIDGPLGRVASHINTLIDAGAHHLLVVNLPPLAHMPAYRGTSQEPSLSQLIPAFNSGLANLLDATAQNRDVQIFPLDFFSMVNEMIGNPTDFGMVDVTSPASLVPGANPAEYLYWDDEHFTTAAYGELGKRAANAVPSYLKAKSQPLIEQADEWRYFAGTTEPSPFPNMAWTTAEFDDVEWQTATEGFGYGQANDLNHVQTVLNDMKGQYRAIYARHAFAVDNVQSVTSLKLQVDYDDAFIAYINGVEISRSNFGANGQPVAFDAAVTAPSHESGFRDLVEIDLATFPELLRVGNDNVLAIQGLNRTLSDSDFVLAQLCLNAILQRGDFNGNGLLDIDDIETLAVEIRSGQNRATFDLDDNGSVNEDDRVIWVHVFRHTWFGDADLNGDFNSNDFVQVFQAGKYETGAEAGWSEGDWNGDGVFDSADFITAFQDGGYEQEPRTDAAAVPEPGSWVLLLLGLAAVVRRSAAAVVN